MMGLVGTEKSYTKIFFAISAVFTVLAFYSFVDELFIRRPWKEYQQEFNYYERQILQKKLDEIRNTNKSENLAAKISQKKKEIEDAETAKLSPEHVQLKKDYDKKQLAYDVLETNIKFDKSILDAIYYKWKHSFHEGDEFAEYENQYKKLDTSINERKKALEEQGKDLEELKKKLNVEDDKIANLKKEILSLQSSEADILEKINAIDTKIYDLGIQQVVVDGFGKEGNIYWGRADRCQTCHVAADRSGYENVVDRFGLTVLKKQDLVDLKLLPEGKADLKESELESLFAKAIAMKQDKDPSLKGFLVSERKAKLLQTMYGTHPEHKSLIGSHPVEKFGCTTCHGGNSRGLRIEGAAFSEGDKAHDYHHHGIEPLLRGIQMQSNCVGCHNGQILFKGAPELTKGARVFVEMGCQGCHLVKGYENLHKAGPDLAKVASKVNRAWMVDWIKNPHEYMPNARMPNFGFSDEEVVAVAIFLTSQSQSHKELAIYGGAGNAINGKKLFDEIGCRGCHSADFNDTQTRQLAPNLSRISTKVKSASWVYDWIKNPKNYSAHSRMPNLRLTDSEASDITAYLWSQNQDYKSILEKRSSAITAQVNPDNKDLVVKGQKIVATRGCYACHNIPGFEHAERIGPELTKESLKETFEFDFGDSIKHDFAFTDTFGRKISVRHKSERGLVKMSQALQDAKVPDGYDQVANIDEESWQSWIRNKILYPLTIYKHERSELKMPQFKLFPDEVDNVIVFLKGLRGRQVGYDFNYAMRESTEKVIAGQRLISKNNCTACHSIDGVDPEILSSISEFKAAHPDERGRDVEWYYPPSLDHVGEKIRPEWLMTFLKNPIPYRPAIFTRMPTFDFSDNDLGVLMNYFAAMNRKEIKFTGLDYTLLSSRIKIGESLMGKDGFDCFSCHLLNGQAPGYTRPANMSSPDLADVKSRLQYDFIVKWIQNPAKYQRYSKMPAFFDSANNAHPDFFGGDFQKQVEAVRENILNFGGNNRIVDDTNKTGDQN